MKVFNMYDGRKVGLRYFDTYMSETTIRAVSEVTDRIMEGSPVSDQEFDTVIAMIDKAGAQSMKFEEFNKLCDAYGVQHNRI